MRLLLDTHVLIWLYNEPAKVPVSVREQVAASGTIYVSAASAWEYENKRRRHSRMVPFLDVLAAVDFEPRDFPFDCHGHASALAPIHSDPFDRMLIAHAAVLGATLVTGDKTIRRYPVETLW